MTGLEVAAFTAASRLAQPAVEAGGKSTGNWLKRNYGYVKHIDKNWKKLEEAKQSLIDKKLGVETELANNSTNKERTEEGDTWLRRVSNIIAEINAVEYDYRNKPSIWLLRKLGKRIVKKTTEATDLKDELSRITAMRDKPASIPHRRRWNNDVRIVDHPSLEKNVATLLEWLKRDELKRICIWGPPGVGKTTIMKSLKTVLDKMPNSCDFDHIFVVTVAATAKNIQEVICSELGVGMDQNTNARERAAAISEKLKAKKYLLFLDEFSPLVNLEEVGIYSNHTKGKVVFVSRDKYTEDTDEDMKVEGLSKEDATTLFWKAVGSEKTGEIKRCGEQIINLCGYMPHMLMLIGKHLSTKNRLGDWREMKKQLQSPSSQPWEEWEEYFRSFKLVYDGLPADDHKHCLLYWSIFPFGEEVNGDRVIDCWAAEQFLIRPRLWQVRDRANTILDCFVDKSLLEKGENLGHFKMFVCFQKAALRIANLPDNQHFFVENVEKIENHTWIQAKRVSLASSCLSSLPKQPKCAQMLTLLLHKNGLTEFPGQFFAGMPGLQVLCLWETGIGGLPSSISKLRNLKGLFLHSCSQLLKLPNQIGDLQSLEILVVCHAGIYSLPSEIGQLGNLKCLRISFNEAADQNHVTAGNNTNYFNFNRKKTEEKIIPGGIINRLSKLEELSIDVTPQVTAWRENAGVIVEEIATLKELTHLHFYFPQTESFELFIKKSESWKANGENREFEGFGSFRFFVGQQGDGLASDFNVFECSAEKHLKFCAGDGFPGAVSEVLKRANSFELIGHTTALNLTDNLPADALQELEACIVKGCGEMQSIVTINVDTTGVKGNCPAATSQELQDSIVPQHDDKMQGNINGNTRTTGGAVKNDLSVATSPKPEIKNITIGNSKATGEEVTVNPTSQKPEMHSNTDGNSKATVRVTRKLPGATSKEQKDQIVEESNNAVQGTTNCNFKATGGTKDNLVAAALQEPDASIVPQGEDARQSITNGNTRTTGVAFQCLGRLHIEKLPKLKHVWVGTLAAESFCRLKTMTLKECQAIERLFSLEMVRQLPMLQHLQVEDCQGIKTIIEAESAVRSMAFPKLKSFQICSLTSLSSICDATLEWPSLETILIKTCAELKTLPHLLGNAPRLREIRCAQGWWDLQAWTASNPKENFRAFHQDLS